MGTHAKAAAIDIGDFAKSTLLALDMWRLPVDPFAIVREEGIELAPGEYSPGFDARIKYISNAQLFIVFYREAHYGLTEGRVRFSIGHELGHYYLPHHRACLLSGKCHNSVSDFRSRNPFEMDADEFSSALLMPRELFAAELKRRHLSICTLSDLSRLAEGAFKTSLTSTVRRYCTFDWEACSMIISDSGRIKWTLHSDTMKNQGLGFIRFGTSVPNTTPTAQISTRLKREKTLDRVEGPVDAEVWFDRPHRSRLWEEALPLGYTGLVLTFLTLEDAEYDE